MTIIGANIDIGATTPSNQIPGRRWTPRDKPHPNSPESQLNTAVDRTGLKQAVANADPWAFDPAMAALKTFARMNPALQFEAYDLEEQFGIRFDTPARWGALFQTAHKAGYIEPAGFTPSRRPARTGGITRVWMAARSEPGR